MKTKITTLREIAEDNPTLCLSPKRIFKECHKCDRFLLSFYKYRDVDKTINSMRCNPQIKDRIKRLLDKKKRLLKEIAKIDRDIGLDKNE